MTTKVIPYEILFRLNDVGEVIGCHRRDLKVLIDGLDTLKKELDPVPIEGAEMEAVLGQINTALMSTLAERDEQIQKLTNSLNNAALFIEELKTQNDALSRANDEQRHILSELSAKNEG